MSSAARADYAAAAVAVLTGEGHENATYELGGDTAWSFAEYAAELSARTGQEIVYNAVSTEVLTGILTGAGLPAPWPGSSRASTPRSRRASWSSPAATWPG